MGLSAPAASAPTTRATQTGLPIQSSNPANVPPAATTPAAPAKPAKPAAPTIEDGTWVVGEDIPAGTYKVTAPVAGDCYWAITKSGPNGSDIINNDIPGGGRPKVTLKKGQDFQTQSCGTWQEVG